MSTAINDSINDTIPAEDPPPYTEIAEGGNVSIEQGANVPRRRPQSQPPRRKPVGPPPGPPPNRQNNSQQYYRPPPGPPPRQGHRPSGTHTSTSTSTSTGTHTNSSSSSSHSGPGSGSYTSSQSSSHRPYPYYHPNPLAPSNGPPSGHNYYTQPPQNRPPANVPSTRLKYPKNYYCPKCGNTGIKINRGTPCKDCYKKFGIPTKAQVIPANFAPVFNAPPRVLPPGHPGIGGKLCGRCKGRGMIYELLLFETTCPLCHGVGRLF